mgnify:CR=1 FL=1
MLFRSVVDPLAVMSLSTGRGAGCCSMIRGNECTVRTALERTPSPGTIRQLASGNGVEPTAKSVLAPVLESIPVA